MCFVIRYGTILDFVRVPLKKIKFFEELLTCTLCIGFHVGWIYAAFFLGVPSILAIICMGFYSAAVCWTADHVIDVMHKYVYGKV